jgi:hypothetical protein
MVTCIALRPLCACGRYYKMFLDNHETVYTTFCQLQTWQSVYGVHKVQMPLPRRCECGYTRAELRCNKCGAYSERQTPPLVEEEAPFKNTKVILERIQIWSWVPTGPETKNDCAGEGQQHITALQEWRTIPGPYYGDPTKAVESLCFRELHARTHTHINAPPVHLEA